MQSFPHSSCLPDKTTLLMRQATFSPYAAHSPFASHSVHLDPSCPAYSLPQAEPVERGKTEKASREVFKDVGGVGGVGVNSHKKFVVFHMSPAPSASIRYCCTLSLSLMHTGAKKRPLMSLLRVRACPFLLCFTLAHK